MDEIKIPIADEPMVLTDWLTFAPKSDPYYQPPPWFVSVEDEHMFVLKIDERRRPALVLRGGEPPLIAMRVEYLGDTES